MLLGTDFGRLNFAMAGLVPDASWVTPQEADVLSAALGLEQLWRGSWQEDETAGQRAQAQLRDVASGLPVPGQEVVDPLGGMVGQPRQHVGEPGFRFVSVELCSLDKGVDGGRPLAAPVRAGEDPIAPADSHTAQGPLGRIV